MVVLVKTFDQNHYKFQLFQLSCEKSKFNYDFTNHGYLQDITNFPFKMFKIMRSLRSSKCLEATFELTFTTQKASDFSPWTACSVFNWKYFFGVNLVQKSKLSV